MRLGSGYFYISSTRSAQRTDVDLSGANILNSSLGENDQIIKKWGGGDAYKYDATNDVHIYDAPISVLQGFKDSNVSVPVQLSDSNNTVFGTDNQTIIGAVNEVQEEMLFQSLLF